MWGNENIFLFVFMQKMKSTPCGQIISNFDDPLIIKRFRRIRMSIKENVRIVKSS